MSFLKKKKQIKQIYISDGNNGCFATDRITVDGANVGYMYREEPDTDSNFPDSGWRFFAGDESDEYLNDSAKIKIYSLNTICNYDKDIIPLLDSPYGTAYIKINGVFQKDNP